MGKQNIGKRPLETIKFRGFNAKNGKWIYGFYLQNRGRHFVCPDEFANGKSWEDYEVLPETVGQYTGLKDKNEKEIWEGDIIIHSQMIDGELFTGGAVEIRWYANDLKFGGWNGFEPTGLPLIKYMEVIGNIHDNPKLLKP